jgi:hypothetical protein
LLHRIIFAFGHTADITIKARAEQIGSFRFRFGGTFAKLAANYLAFIQLGPSRFNESTS